MFSSFFALAKVGRYQTEGLVSNVKNVAAVVKKSLSNRATVTQNEADVQILEDCVARLDVLESTGCRLAFDNPNDRERVRICEEAITGIQRAESIVRKAVNNLNFSGFFF